MLQAKGSNDNATGRQLKLSIGLVVVMACFMAILVAVIAPPAAPPIAVMVAAAGVIAVASRISIELHVRGSRYTFSWSDVALLVTLAVVPAPWNVLCVVAGVLTGKLVKARLTAEKVVFAVAKDTLMAACAAAVLVFAGVPSNLAHPSMRIIPLTTAFLVLAAVDTVAFTSIIAVASGARVPWRFPLDWRISLVTYAARLALFLAIVGAFASTSDFVVLATAPLLIACVHLWHSRRVRTRDERASWQRLAKATDELNAVDLTRVLESGAQHAAEIFSAFDAEVDLSVADRDRVVRATPDQVVYDGPRADADQLAYQVVTDLVTHDGRHRVGVLRLRFGETVRLGELEQYKLGTFTSALCTAIRNADAYAELARISAQNAHDAAHDALTGLPNRRRLIEQARQTFDARLDDGILALVFIDLNHFKEINDTLGHAAGDRVLREVAHRLRDAARPDDLVARLGGDEFGVLMTGLPSPAMAAHRAEAMLSALDGPIEVDGLQLGVEGAGGIAVAPGTGGVQELMRRADVAMYQAKRSGRRTATYAHAADPADLGRLALGNDLQRAMDRHEFIVDFQPIVELGSGEVVAAEALARWHHPEQGSLSAARFLETVERSGKLRAFAAAVLEQSLSAVSAWRESGFDLPVAVNVSARSLLDPEFPATVLSRLERLAIPADRLVLELSEVLTSSQIDTVTRTLGQLRDAGVRLALDDFGSGLSSLSVLSRIPVHQLKIDRDFVVAVETSSEAAAVIRSTVDLARSLQLSVVAAGVESEPQRHALWELGCLAGQGHLFARPMAAGRMLATLQRGNGVLAGPLHTAGSVIRLPRRRARTALPNLPA